MLRVYGVKFTTAKSNHLSVNSSKMNKSVTESHKDLLMSNLNALARINQVSFTGKAPNLDIGLSHEELTKRTSPDYFAPKTLLGVDAPEYKNLAKGDKEALKHLVKAAYILKEVYLKQDNAKNIPFRDKMQKLAKQGDKDAKMALKLFEAQQGVNATDSNAVKFSLIKNEKVKPGNGLFPRDLSIKEFKNIVSNMLDEGKDAEVKKILNQRSVIKRDGKYLKAFDYTEEYKKEFTAAAEELKKAAKVSTNKDFNEYLMLQAKALTINNPMADALADKKWATLEDTPLEFTITRENYNDLMTQSVADDAKLAARVKAKGISVIPKDSLGFRVGIINKKGTEDLFKIKKYLPMLAKEMPFADKYKQTISTDTKSNLKQTMVDVDLVAVTGDVGAFRGGITLAENLPNDDKLSLKIGGGRRNVYHRQIRMSSNPSVFEKINNAILAPETHQYYLDEAKHWFVIGHENTHSLGPKDGVIEALGSYGHIIEENKADMGSLGLLDKLVELGMYT